MIPDLIVSWPRNCDYPLWRQFIRENRARFNEIIIVFMETNYGANYREFIKSAMFADHALFIESLPLAAGDDWRDRAIHSALLHSYGAQWIFFTEQDFLPTDGFWTSVEDYEKTGLRVIGVKDNARLHPCCLFMRRDRLASLDLNFGIVPNKSDHFSLIQKQLENEAEPIGLIPAGCFNHLNGLSHNMTLIARGENPNYQPDKFNEYILYSLKQRIVPIDASWKKIFEEYLNHAGIQVNVL